MKSGITDREEDPTTALIPEGYKKTRYGLRPKDWKLYRVGEVLNRVSNPVDVRSERIYREIGIRSHGKGIFYKEETTGKNLGNKSVFWVEPDCFILNIVFAWERAVAKTSAKEKGFIASHRFPMYKPVDDKISLDFITYFFASQQGENILKLASPGGAGRNKTLGQKEFFDSELIIPSDICEQQKIANILLVWDKAIELKEYLIQLKRNQKKGLMQKLLSGKIRWNDNEKNSSSQIKHRIELINSQKVPEEYRKTKIGVIPADWAIKKAKEIFDNYSDKNHDGELEVLSSTQEKGIIPRSQVDIEIKYDEGNLRSYKKVERGNFVISLRSFQGGIEYSEYDGIISPAYTVLRNKIEIEHDFYRLFFKTEDFIKRLNSLIYGIRDGKQIGYGDFGELYLPYPSPEEQRNIAQILSVCDKEIDLLSQELVSLRQQKKGLMQLLLTGKVRVKC